MNLYTSEIYSASTGVFSAGSNLKDDIGRVDGCLAQIDSNSFIIIGGATDAGYDRALVRHDIDTGLWTDLQKPNIGRAGGATCGHFNGKNVKTLLPEFLSN